MTEAGTGNTPNNPPTGTGSNPGQGGTPPAQGQEAQPQLSPEAVTEFLTKNPEFTAKLIQPAVDSAISKHVNEKNELRSKLEQFELSGKTELEKTQYQLEKEAKARQDLEQRLNGMALENFKNEAIVDFGLTKDDLPLIAGNSVEEIKTKAEALQKRYQGIQEKTKQDLIKNASGVPNVGGTATGKNPFNDESWNPQEQLKLSQTDPKLYAEMRGSAKVNPKNTKVNL